MGLHSYICDDARDAAAQCAAKILELLGATLDTAPRASLAISGGTTPKLMFAELAQARFDWDKVHLFWVDERGVPPTDPQSNYKLAKESFLDPTRFPGRNVHRIQAELPPEDAARLYAEEIRNFFGVPPSELPSFDIIHRGMGPDAHTASLFPGEPLIDDRTNLAAAVYVEKFHQWRITLLPGVLMAAKQTIMLVAGEDKAEPLRSVLHGPFDPKRYPAQIATHDGRDVLWFLDRAAAGQLK
ncbi:MAG: 6-phosphogluconolactonase [Acidobacteriia bacterium]|nr:6-phosphogluconolactonase [Terriglobia bacterium]